MGTSLGNVFVVGGTGMLAEAAIWIANRASSLTLAARRPEPLANTLGATLMYLDWSDRTTTLPDMTFDMVITWLHDDAIWLARPVEDLLKPNGRSIRVHGSNLLDPAVRAQRVPNPRADVKRQTVILGWFGSGKDKRWLTNFEISQWVITAINSPDRETIIVGDANG